MASMEGPARALDRHARRRPFANWMKRLANLKNLHNDPTNATPQSRSVTTTSPSRGKKYGIVKSSPYFIPSRSNSANIDAKESSNTHVLVTPPLSSQSPASRHSSISRGKVSMTLSQDGQNQPKSRAPTLATTAETTVSGAETNGTVPRTEGDRDSTFSSPAPSLRSMTTTLTTMQSTTPAIGAPNTTGSNPVYSSTHPASAVPPHLAPHSHPATYHIATANGVLSDDASILTLASSSKRRRRNSLDTNASIRALAPQSVFGGSRESLPLSVLSGSVTHQNSARDMDNASFRDNASVHYPRSISAMNVDRASLISASGVAAPALTSERNSYMSNKLAGDGASVRSGLLSHGTDKERDRSIYHARNDSIGGLSITRERFKDAPRDSSGQDYFKEREMVTAPTSPMPA